MLSAECVLEKRVRGETEGDTGAILENNDFDLHRLHDACCGGSGLRLYNFLYIFDFFQPPHFETQVTDSHVLVLFTA